MTDDGIAATLASSGSDQLPEGSGRMSMNGEIDESSTAHTPTPIIFNSLTSCRGPMFVYAFATTTPRSSTRQP
jgi:hypothetical protein